MTVLWLLGKERKKEEEKCESETNENKTDRYSLFVYRSICFIALRFMKAKFFIGVESTPR